MSACADGLNKMHPIIAHAVGDIRYRLWTFYWLSRLVEARTIIELGVREGDSTRAFLCAAEDIRNCTVVSFDIEDSAPAVREHTRRCGVNLAWDCWEFHHCNSIDAGKGWQWGPVDLVFVDTDHTLLTTVSEINAWHEHVKPGGCMVFHDYWLSDKPRDGVKTAVDAFSDRNYGEWKLETHDAGPDGDTGLAILWKLKKAN